MHNVIISACVHCLLFASLAHLVKLSALVNSVCFRLDNPIIIAHESKEFSSARKYDIWYWSEAARYLFCHLSQVRLLLVVHSGNEKNDSPLQLLPCVCVCVCVSVHVCHVWEGSDMLCELIEEKLFFIFLPLLPRETFSVIFMLVTDDVYEHQLAFISLMILTYILIYAGREKREDEISFSKLGMRVGRWEYASSLSDDLNFLCQDIPTLTRSLSPNLWNISSHYLYYFMSETCFSDRRELEMRWGRFSLSLIFCWHCGWSDRKIEREREERHICHSNHDRVIHTRLKPCRWANERETILMMMFFPYMQSDDIFLLPACPQALTERQRWRQQY
jgi:hypothetical protein